MSIISGASRRFKDALRDTFRRELLSSKIRAAISAASGVSKRTIAAALVFACILFIAGALRIMPLRWGFFLSEFDPYFQYRMAEYVSNNGYPAWFGWHDDMSWYPFGRDIARSAFPALSFTAAALHRILTILGFQVTLFQLCVVFPVIMGVLTCAAIYALGRHLWGGSVGLFAALFMAINGSHLGRTSLGFFDDESIGILSLVLVFLLYLRAVSPERSVKSSAIHGILAGLILAYLTWGWGAFRYPMVLLSLFSLALVLLRRYSSRVIISYAATYGIQLLAATQLPYLGTRVLTEWSTLLIYGILAMLVAVEISARLQTRRQKTVALLGVCGAAFAILALIWIQGMATPLMAKFMAVLDPTRRLDMPLMESVAEHRPATWASFFYESGIILFLGIFGLIFPIQRLRNGDLLLVMFGVSAMYFAGSLVRLTLIMAPALSLLAAIAVIELARPSVDVIGEAVVFPRRKVRFASRVGREFGVAILVILIILLLPTLAAGTKAAYTPTTIATSSLPAIPKEGTERNYQDWLETLAWMRNNLPRDSVVLSWWDYGYWITALGEKRTLADNGTINSTQIGVVARMFIMNETMSAPILRKYDVTHVAVFAAYSRSSEQEISFYGVGEDSKWYWMAKICNGTVFDGMKIIVEESRTENTVSYRRKIYEGSRLAGDELIADNEGVKSATMVGALILKSVGAYTEDLEYFEQVYISKSGWVTVYEVVYPEPSYITCRLSADRIAYNETVVEISGRVWGDKAIEEVIPVTIQYSEDGGLSWLDLAIIPADDSGGYSYRWEPKAGSYLIRASWEGVPRKLMKALSSPVGLEVEKVYVDVSVELSSLAVPVNNAITIDCRISPALVGGTFHAEYSMDNETWFTIEYSSLVAGRTMIHWTPQKTGTYYVRVTYLGTESELTVSPKYFTVTVT